MNTSVAQLLLLYLLCGCLLTSLPTTKGAGSYTISSRVFTSEAKRQGIRQDNPCPGDRVVFTCIRNETSEERIAVRWTANGTPLYTFGIPNDIGTPRANQDAGFPGLIGVLIDARTFTLSVDLSTSVDIINGTQVGCGEVLNDVSSPPVTLFIIGVASAPAAVSVSPAGFTGIYVDVTIPSEGSICVDEYRANISGIQVGQTSLSLAVTDARQRVYRFRFAADLCQELMTGLFATANAVSNGVSGPSMTVRGPVDTLNRTDLILNAFTTQIFTASGIMLTFINDLVDPALMSPFNISCQLIEDPSAAPLNCLDFTIGIPTITEHTILVPYNSALMNGGVTFRLVYSYRLCRAYEQVNFTVRPVNSTVPQVLQNRRELRMGFNENVFERVDVQVVLSSNCTSSVTIGYSNPLLVTIPDTGLNSGLCQYNIQLVDSDSQLIGYPVLGFFVAEELPAVSSSTSGGAVAGGVLAVIAALVIIGFVVFGIVGYCVYKKRGSGKNAQSYGFNIEHPHMSTTSETTENTTLEDDQVSVNTVIEKREMTESIFMSSGYFQVKPMSVTFSDDELDMLTERMTKPTLIPSAIPTFPTEVVNVKTGAPEITHVEVHASYRGSLM